MQTIKQAFEQAKKSIQSDTPALDSEILLAQILRKPRNFIYTWPEFELSSKQQDQLQQLVQRRRHGEPMAYILGYKEFWSLKLKINPSVLIPRPETELLVETATKLLPNHRLNIADLGTGSGAIALALSKERPNWQIIATDISPNAIKIAKQNQATHQCENIQFIEMHWGTGLTESNFDLIISNPPYIEQNDPHLTQGDVQHEPKKALIAADNGFADIHFIIKQAANLLKPSAYLLLEHGYQQGIFVQNLFKQNNYYDIKTIKDLAGLERVTYGKIKP